MQQKRNSAAIFNMVKCFGFSDVFSATHAKSRLQILKKIVIEKRDFFLRVKQGLKSYARSSPIYFAYFRQKSLLFL